MSKRVTLSLSSELLGEIHRREVNLSHFVLQAVRRELQWRRREKLQRSLARPHPESKRLAQIGLRVWATSLPQDHAEDLVDVKGGTPVRWVPGKGWSERRRSVHPAGPASGRRRSLSRRAGGSRTRGA